MAVFCCQSLVCNHCYHEHHKKQDEDDNSCMIEIVIGMDSWLDVVSDVPTAGVELHVVSAPP